MPLKLNENLSSWKNLATYWLTTDIHNYTKDLIRHNKTKTIKGKKTFYFKDIINYIKNYNKNIPNIKPETKIIYQNIIQHHAKQYKIAGEIQW